MKRVNLLLDERLLAEAMRVLDAPTYSSAVNTALQEMIRMRKIQKMPDLRDVWARHPEVPGDSGRFFEEDR